MNVSKHHSNLRDQMRPPDEECCGRQSRHEDLLVPFPSGKNKDLMEGRLLDMLAIRCLRNQTLEGSKNNALECKSKKSNDDTHSQLPSSQSCLVKDDSDEGVNFESISSSSSSTFHHYLDPISVVTVVGDTDEFKKLQEALRGSRMVTTGGAHAMLNSYIHSHRANVEARQAENQEWKKIKNVPIKETKASQKSAISPLRERLMSNASRWKTSYFSSSSQLSSSSPDQGTHDMRHEMRRCFSERLNHFQLRINNLD